MRSEPTFYRLQSPRKLNMGLSIHSVWCPEDVLHSARGRYGDRFHRQRIRAEAFQNDYGAFQHFQNTKNDQKPDLSQRQNRKEDKKIEQLMRQVRRHFIAQTLEHKIGQPS